MDYKIVKKESFQIIGKSQRISCTNGIHQQLIPQFWEESHQNGLYEKLEQLAGKLGMLGICMDFDPNLEELTYVIAVEKPEFPVTDDFRVMEIPAATWAVFEAVGPLPGAIQKVWKGIFLEWLPGSGYDHGDAPDLEVYPLGDTNNSYKCEVWVPIIKNSLQ